MPLTLHFPIKPIHRDTGSPLWEWNPGRRKAVAEIKGPHGWTPYCFLERVSLSTRGNNRVWRDGKGGHVTNTPRNTETSFYH